MNLFQVCVEVLTYTAVQRLNEINTFIQQGCIKLIKSTVKTRVTKDFYCK